MRKVKLIIAYDGTDFFGFQRQPEFPTIQGTVEEALSRITGEPIQIHGSGRTDAGVHALGQVCHFTTTSPIPAEKYPYILRHILPRAIIVRSGEEVDDDFHARVSAHWKTYRYQIDTNPIPDLSSRRFRTHLPFSVDLAAMQEAGNRLLGTHDFTSFCSAKTLVEDRVRTIYCCQVGQDPIGIYIQVTGNGFLYNMVRILAGTLYEVGRGERSPEEITRILEATDRTQAGLTLPPEGLQLVEVGYKLWNRGNA